MITEGLQTKQKQLEVGELIRVSRVKRTSEMLQP